MKTTEKNRLLKKITFDSKLGAPHYRVILLMAMSGKRKMITSAELQEELQMKPQQVSKVLKDLVDLGYVELAGQMKSGRVLYYSLVIPAAE